MYPHLNSNSVTDRSWTQEITPFQKRRDIVWWKKNLTSVLRRHFNVFSRRKCVFQNYIETSQDRGYTLISITNTYLSWWKCISVWLSVLLFECINILVGSLVSISEVRGSSLVLSTTKISLILYVDWSWCCMREAILPPHPSLMWYLRYLR